MRTPACLQLPDIQTGRKRLAGQQVLTFRRTWKDRFAGVSSNLTAGIRSKPRFAAEKPGCGLHSRNQNGPPLHLNLAGRVVLQPKELSR